MKRLLVAGLLVLSGIGLAAPRATALGTVQPGDYIETSIGACTLGFVFDGTGTRAGNVYFSTAAHCVRSIGEDIRLLDGTIIGDVAVVGGASAGEIPPTAQDWALILVRDQYEGNVRGAVRGHPSTPTGYTTPSMTNQFDLVRFSGYGLGFDFLALTRESRVGLMGGDNTETYDLIGMDVGGDSGGPIIHDPTGRALGLVSRGCVGAVGLGVCLDPLGTSVGPTIQGIVAKASGKTYPVHLRTA